MAAKAHAASLQSLVENLRAKGAMSYNALAAELNRLGVPARAEEHGSQHLCGRCCEPKAMRDRRRTAALKRYRER